MSLFAELKRRNVFRVGVAYVVGGWLLLQFTDVLTELLNLPDSLGPVVVAVVSIGFPIALFFAWAYELTPEGVKREQDIDRSQSNTLNTTKKLNGVIIGLMAIAIIALLADRFWTEAPQPTPSEAEPVVESIPPGHIGEISDQSIAVLPFEIRSSVAEDEFFIDGFHDDLLTALARIGSIKVISRTSVAKYRKSDKSIPEIARELGVATIMEGGVQRAGSNIRINVQLIDARTDEHLWADSFDREISTENLFSIQSEISSMIADALKAKLTEEEEQRLELRPTESLAAYSAFLRGQRAFARREVDSMNEALAEFQRATELDPEFAEAWAGVAFVATVIPSWSNMDRDEAKKIATEAADRASQIAPNLGESILARAMIAQKPEKELLFRQAIEKLPSYAPAYQWYANAIQGRPERFNEALALFRKAADLDPLSPILQHQVARHLQFMGRYEEARREIEHLLESDPNYFPAVSWMGTLLSREGQFAEAILWNRKSVDLDPVSPFPDQDAMTIFNSMKDEQRLLELIQDMSERGRPPSMIAQTEISLSVLRGNYQGAREILGSIEHENAELTYEARYWIHLFERDYQSARDIRELVDPKFFDPETLYQAIEARTDLGCSIAYILIRKGEADLGQQLLNDTIAYTENVLSKYTEHANEWAQLHHCYAVAGDLEKSLAIIETLLEHRHFAYWWDIQRLEYFEPLYGQPRFEDLVQRFEAEMEFQREKLARLELQDSGA